MHTLTLTTVTLILELYFYIPRPRPHIIKCPNTTLTLTPYTHTHTHTPTTGFPIMHTGVQAIRAGSHHAFAIKSADVVWAAGANTFGQLGDGTKYERTKYSVVNGLTGQRRIVDCIDALY